MRSVIWRILLFYVAALVVLMMGTPWTNARADQSPFVQTFALAGLAAAAGVINFVVITSAASSCNSGTYSTSRMLLGLASRRSAPKALDHLSSRHTPDRALLVSATVDAPKGSFDGPQRSFAIYANDQLTRSAPYDDLILAYRNGAPVRVRDIGRAVDGPENARLAGWQNGSRGIQLMIFKQPGANVIETVDRITAALPRMQAAVPPAITVQVMVDRTVTIRASVEEVQFTLMLSIALVVMVIFLFLRSFWATVIPSVTVPLALVGSVAGLKLSGQPLSVAALVGFVTLAGIATRNGILKIGHWVNLMRVEGEAFSRPMVVRGSMERLVPVLMTALTAALALSPLLLEAEQPGTEILHPVAVVIFSGLVSSTLLDAFVTPVLFERFGRRPAERLAAQASSEAL